MAVGTSKFSLMMVCRENVGLYQITERRHKRGVRVTELCSKNPTPPGAAHATLLGTRVCGTEFHVRFDP